jgi:preprotein translocase subunit YajC
MGLILAIVTAAATPAGGGDWQEMLVQFAPLALIAFAGYFLMIRPQQQRQRAHVARVKAIKRGDTVVMSNGMIGKVVRVEDEEIGVEIAQNVTVKVVKAMIQDVRVRGEPAAKDAKA